MPFVEVTRMDQRKRELIFYRHSQLRGLRVMEREPTIEAEAAP
jgi:hypothetical protein